ncbi:L,D-transpeptidase family protein [Lactobacillus sp. LC28-10]|uniref:L,D-transpeptidase family protein n=1 Tax=Secundilactobacillus angelensis TaxID=2722706 RepID=A0ABX1L1E7_9LACO|nr:L,D-transpeptidase family protein [Secundilactobacillus angelensis]MCH5463086.1 L,D-transpeptidase/peptidoglycan binding protein [Secundilactobacillus angelensis]NLR18893.1 L,D-transpeptidase family protein [Secundilactobacillus angelensis]
MTHRSRWVSAGLTVIAILAIGYGWRTAHYNSHFLSDTQIGGIQVGGQTAEQAAQTLKTKLSNQTYTVKEHSKSLAQFTSREAGVKAYSTTQLKQMIAKQNAFSWPAHIISASADDKRLSASALNDADLTTLATRIVQTAGTNRTSTHNAKLAYKGHQFTIQKPVYGTEVSQASVKSALADAIEKHQSTINLARAYVKPTVTEKSKALVKAKNQAEKLAKNQITYHITNHSIKVPSDTIASWLTSKNGKIAASNSKIEAYLTKLSYQYGTIHKTRHFKAHDGKTVKVPAGIYGWSIKVASETPILAKAVLAGKSMTRTPVIQGTGYHKDGSDLGSTYIEVSKSAQHMWVHKNGKVIISTAVVTGKPVSGTTPSGVFDVWSKQRNATLRGKNDDGSNYASPVKYWMPIDNTGVGIHDSPWQPRYGGNWYLTHGSHGCVNTPPSVVSKVFAAVPLHTPVVIY